MGRARRCHICNKLVKRFTPADKHEMGFLHQLSNTRKACSSAALLDVSSSVLTSRKLLTLMGLTTSEFFGTHAGSSKPQSADSPSLRSSWEILFCELVQAVPELEHTSRTPSIPCHSSAHCTHATVRRIIFFLFVFGYETARFISCPLLLVWKKMNKLVCICLLHDPLHFIDHIHTPTSFPGWLLFFPSVPEEVGKWLLIPFGWGRWALVFCPPLPKWVRKIPAVLKFCQWMCVFLREEVAKGGRRFFLELKHSFVRSLLKAPFYSNICKRGTYVMK